MTMLACDRATVRSERAALGRTDAEVHLCAPRQELEQVAVSGFGRHHRAWIVETRRLWASARGAAAASFGCPLGLGRQPEKT